MRLHQVTLLGFALALCAAPLAAAGPAAPLCPADGAPALAVPAPEAAPADGLAPAGDLAPTAGAETAPEPQPLFDPVPVPPGGGQCGLVICPVGTRCCNPLCSACTPPGVECTLGDCGHGPTS